jgi:hypothetical protein
VSGLDRNVPFVKVRIAPAGRALGPQHPDPMLSAIVTGVVLVPQIACILQLPAFVPATVKNSHTPAAGAVPGAARSFCNPTTGILMPPLNVPLPSIRDLANRHNSHS